MQALWGDEGTRRQSCLTRGHAATIMNRSSARKKRKELERMGKESKCVVDVD